MAPLAKDIKTTEDSFRVTSKGGNTVASPEWNLKRPGLLEELLVIKMEEHPELLERLLETYPLDLIKACTDDTRGGGAPHSTLLYMTVMSPYLVKILLDKLPLGIETIKYANLGILEPGVYMLYW